LHKTRRKRAAFNNSSTMLAQVANDVAVAMANRML
jgi:hypothetical protein